MKGFYKLLWGLLYTYIYEWLSAPFGEPKAKFFFSKFIKPSSAVLTLPKQETKYLLITLSYFCIIQGEKALSPI
jgi:hypothetical protein